MYYTVSFTIYFILVLILCIAFLLFKKKNDEEKNAKLEYAKTFVVEMEKGLSKSDVKSRKQRVKILPIYVRALYWIWFFITISFFIVFPAVLALARGVLIQQWFAPDTAIEFSDNSISLLVIFFAGMLFGVSLSIGFSYLTYTRTIAKADAVYRMGSFQVYPKQLNFIIALIAVVTMLPILIFSFNNYQYFTEEEMVQKPVFAFSEKKYPYSEIEFIEKKIYTDGEVSTIAHLQSNKKIELYSVPIDSDNPELHYLIESLDFPTKETRVLSLAGKIKKLFSGSS